MIVVAGAYFLFIVLILVNRPLPGDRPEFQQQLFASSSLSGERMRPAKSSSLYLANHLFERAAGENRRSGYCEVCAKLNKCG